MLDFLDFLSRNWDLFFILLFLVSLLFILERKYSAALLTAQQLVRMINNNESSVIDIRDAKEYSNGHIISAVNYPAKTTSHMEDTIRAQSKKVVLVCQTGIMSKSMGKKFKIIGIDVSILNGGVAEWINNSYPLQRK